MSPALLAGIVATSALGSLHCVAMCGPLVGLHGGARSMRLALAHSLGRLTTYGLLGALAGLLGGALDLAGRLSGVQRIAMLTAGGAVIAVGLVHAARALGIRWLARERTAKRPAFSSALVQLRTRKPQTRAWLMGTLTGLIPCGWLWAFVVTAGSTAHASAGALVMAAFWLGTVPAMVGVLGFAGPVFARLRARMPAVTALALIALGTATLALRWHDAGTAQVTAPHCPSCHGGAS
ncbi:MAG: sulfite exporter TauE/SafE family protein [Kofleriaceae bacterium]|nr:sulfite exporter TauE/SafE family protein [Kofleriaceae bacterium]